MPKRWPTVLCALIVFVLPAAVLASERPTPRFDLHDRSLVLNGYGEREHWWTDVYRCALYLPQRSADIGFINSPQTAKAIRIRILYGDVPDRMPAGWLDVFASELSRELLGRLKKTYRTLGDRDTLTFAYSPGKGTEIWINGEKFITDPGHGLMQGLLDQWLGARPVSKNLKRLLLNPAT